MNADSLFCKHVLHHRTGGCQANPLHERKATWHRFERDVDAQSILVQAQKVHFVLWIFRRNGSIQQMSFIQQ